MDDIESMIHDCINRESKMSPWEQEFIKSIDEQFSDRGSITDRQQ